MQKYRLFAPGPTPVPECVRLRMAESILHHRTPAFGEVFGRVREGLKWIFQSEGDVLSLAATGTAAMEGSVSNFLSKGDEAIFVNSGKFGERWGKILEAYGCKAIELKVPWGRCVEVASVEKALRDHPNARAVYLQASETSTGVAHPVAEVASLCKNLPGTLCVVDGITAVGVFDVALDRDGIDVLVSGSQKAFMLPPGLAFVGISEKAWSFCERADLPRYYLDFVAERKAEKKNNTAYTSAVSLISGLDASLKLMREEGLVGIFSRHARLAGATRAGLGALGCEMYATPPSAGVTAACAPGGIDAQKIVATLRDSYNMTIAGGQDDAKGKIFRVAHMGHFDDLDVLTMLVAVESALCDLGVKIERGQGVAAAQIYLASAKKETE